ncbi:coiled-coil domain-containing protein [Hirsutella rhossiliensis]|uniref:Coiled-coil domain-containing protein n=1 Tax=Hirsutella rhossiliensis TaxID=111463 RepID=A0A9P8SN41_9HYPO|nr:coiled-coil domain-containing protein [Hirsutella rhossiliensis]KAH0966786.1 coiled-coil domain-containing protein [Hirsutella rhossiliensis]
MSKPGFSFGLSLPKKQGAKKPGPAARRTIFGDDDNDSDNDGAKGADRGENIGGELDFSIPAAREDASSSKGPRLKSKLPAQPPKLKARSQQSPGFGDLSSALTARKHAEAAMEVDPTVYEYDSVYDSLKPKKHATKEDERKPKYMQSLMQAAEVRKRDALIAEEKKIAREREAEGDEFADKEKFVTEAYKKQQEENKRLEEEEKRREEEEAKKNKDGGMSAFYRRLLDKGEQRHAEALKATQESAKDGPKTAEDEGEDDDREKAEAALARELNEKGASVAVNEDGQVVDKRQLLKGGLNVGSKKREDAHKEAKRPGESDQRYASGAQANRKQGMRERQSRMLEEQLEQSMKRSREAEEAERQDVERSAKSRKTEGEISSARERYLARKRAAEEAKSKGLAD